MTAEKDLEFDTPVRDVIRRLLLNALPGDLRASVFELADCVTEHPDVDRTRERSGASFPSRKGHHRARSGHRGARRDPRTGIATAAGEHLHSGLRTRRDRNDAGRA